MTNDYDKIMGSRMLALYLERVEKIERAGANSSPSVEYKLATLQLITETFDMIRSDPPKAYIRLMNAAVNAPSSAKQEYVNRIAFFGRLAGFALMISMQSEDVFNRVMAVNEKPVTA